MQGEEIERDHGFPTTCLSMTSYYASIRLSYNKQNESKLSEVYEHEKSNKTKLEIGTNHSTKELLYTHIYWAGVEVIVLA